MVENFRNLFERRGTAIRQQRIDLRELSADAPMAAQCAAQEGELWIDWHAATAHLGGEQSAAQGQSTDPPVRVGGIFLFRSSEEQPGNRQDPDAFKTDLPLARVALARLFDSAKQTVSIFYNARLAMIESPIPKVFGGAN